MIDEPKFDGIELRQVMSKYPTGVVAVTACGIDGSPVGMVLGSFGAVSLDPPLVCFMPSKSSSSWKKLSMLNEYCINVVGTEQKELCTKLASKDEDKFDGLEWTASGLGAPAFAHAVFTLDCIKHDVIDAGDHQIVLCRVVSLGIVSGDRPLVFYGGALRTVD